MAAPLARVVNVLAFSRRFKVSIPAGALFYPQCGLNTTEPLLQFMQSVEEFHFVDSTEVPQLPILNCNYNKQLHGLNEDTLRRGYIPVDIVSAARPAYKYNQFKACAERAALSRDTSKCYDGLQEIWTVTGNPPRRVRVFCHRMDELAALDAIDNISVFYSPGFSTGDKERRAIWFGPDVAQRILNKLVDGGLIITSPCAGARCDLLWRRLAKRSLRGVEFPERNRRPENFTYYNRRFRCLGECGYRLGPIFAWQVQRL